MNIHIISFIKQNSVEIPISELDFFIFHQHCCKFWSNHFCDRNDSKGTEYKGFVGGFKLNKLGEIIIDLLWSTSDRSTSSSSSEQNQS